jgi:hypothetical protein
VQVEMNQRQATPEELAAFAQEGEVSLLDPHAAMAVPSGGGDPVAGRAEGVDRTTLLRQLHAARGRLADRPRGLQVAIGPELADKLGARSDRTCASAMRACASSA